MRVSGVRRSWLTPASISVRWLIWRSMRSRMARKARAAWRISVAPPIRRLPTGRPLPSRSAASARRMIGRIWLRKKMTALPSRINEAPSIHSTKMVVVVLSSRLRGVSTRSTPSCNWTRISTSRSKPRVSMVKGRNSRSFNAWASVRSTMEKTDPLRSVLAGRIAPGIKLMSRS